MKKHTSINFNIKQNGEKSDFFIHKDVFLYYDNIYHESYPISEETFDDVSNIDLKHLNRRYYSDIDNVESVYWEIKLTYDDNTSFFSTGYNEMPDKIQELLLKLIELSKSLRTKNKLTDIQFNELLMDDNLCLINVYNSSVDFFKFNLETMNYECFTKDYSINKYPNNYLRVEVSKKWYYLINTNNLVAIRDYIDEYYHPVFKFSDESVLKYPIYEDEVKRNPILLKYLEEL